MNRTVSILGAGRVGRTLGRRLRELGWTVEDVITRHGNSARAAVLAIGAGRACFRPTRRILNADVVLITTPDHAIGDVAKNLARIGGEEWKRKIVLHTSGAYDRRVLEPLARLGAATGSIHPLQTFSGRGLPRLDGVIFVLEGETRAVRLARAIAISLGGDPVRLSGRDKPAYHAAGAFAAGHVLAVMEAASLILMDLGFTRRRARQALIPLVRQTIENFELLGPRATWTGPLSRGDYSTVAKHVEALERFPREVGESNAALSRLAARLLADNPRKMLRQLERVSEKPKGGRR